MGTSLKLPKRFPGLPDSPAVSRLCSERSFQRSLVLTELNQSTCWSSRQTAGSGQTEVVTTTASPGKSVHGFLPSKQTWAVDWRELSGSMQRDRVREDCGTKGESVRADGHQEDARD